MQHHQASIPAAAPPASTPFQLEEALFSSAPVGLHCINSSGIILWANNMELTLLGFTREQYVGQQVESLVYMDLEKVDSNSYLANTAAQQQLLGSNNSNTTASASNNPLEQGVVANFVNDRTLYKEVLKQITSGRAVHDIPIRFVTYSGTVLHLILDCDAVPHSHAVTEERYYRCFTRDDTARRIQEMRSNVLFQETNRSLQMLDSFMNRSMTQMRLPLALMERACNLVAENIEDIDEVISAQANNATIILNHTIPPPVATVQAATAMTSSLKQTQQQTGGDRKRSAVVMRPVATNLAGSRQNAAATPTNPLAIGNIDTNFASPLAVALSATSEARNVVGLASRIVDDALALVDDITDLCRFDQGQVLVVDKEAVKLREVCIEALNRVPIPLCTRGVEVLLDIQTGTPARAMADRSVLQRILALLMNFAVDAAANAVSKATQSQVTGKVILSISDAALYQAQGNGGASSCKISVFYTNPPDADNVKALAGMSIDDSSSGFGQNDEVFASGTGRGGSMTRRTRLRENIERGMTTYQREKLGLGLSLVHHLVSAHGSDLRYEIVADETMTKFWFLLPTSLDFPERLNAERILKDEMQGYNMQASASRPLKRPKVAETMVMPFPSSSPVLPVAAAEAHFMPELNSPAITTQAASGAGAAASLPNADETTKSAEPKQPRQYPGVEPGARPLVLVVEDTDVSASLLCMHLRKLNCTSHRAENGEVALEMLRSAPDPSMYSLVLMDLRMPVMDGFEAAAIIRGSIATNIPIVALTGETSELHKRKCEEIGFDAFETKPLKRPQLKELLHKLVGYQAPPESVS
ncbi:hypothetical protein ACHAWO_012329 [Cyclotella atomus]|uniref:histidine kinase n=1 Tax=Cyclotella atomus TaxID=382360 RepID=A0ABD3N9B2_9STRA